MSHVKNFSEWRAEQIAKLFLVSQKGIQVSADGNPFFDFTAYFEKPDKTVVTIGVSSIPTKYARQDIPARLALMRDKAAEVANRVNLPIANFYINIDSEKGFFEVIQPTQATASGVQSIHTLSKASFREELSHL